MLAKKVFFSFTELQAPDRHEEYNAWHQLDHRPENMALGGVVHGERWVRSPDCAHLGPAANSSLDGTHYVNMYWFRDPVDQSIAEWQELAERSFQWGRRPELRFAERPLMGFFSTVKGYAAPRVLVSPDALPFRPCRGIHLSLSRIHHPHGADAEGLYSWYDRTRIPQLLECPGVAGAWTFVSDSTTLDADDEATKTNTFRPSGQEPGKFRVVLLFLDDDPLHVMHALGERSLLGPPADSTDQAGVEEVVFSSPLRTIEPWNWGWFEER